MKNKFLLVFIFINLSCNKIHYYPDKEFSKVTTKFLMHRGGGNSGFKENTFKAAHFGLERLDGIEIDIQISKDRTIWLSHNYELVACGNFAKNCFPETKDFDIFSLDSCLKTTDFTMLEDVFKLVQDSFPNKYISLDVKAWYPCHVNSLNVTDGLNIMAEEIIRLKKKYNRINKIMVESETATFLSYIKEKSPDIETYLTTLGDFERGVLLALKAGYTGLSFKYQFKEVISIEHIKMIRKKGLKIQLWTINNLADLKEAYLINPDFIQTDEYSLVEDNF